MAYCHQDASNFFRALRCNRALRLRQQFSIQFSKFRETSRRGTGIVAIPQLASSRLAADNRNNSPVEEMGLEPTTLGLQSRCSTS
jgi:hypothetical protein